MTPRVRFTVEGAEANGHGLTPMILLRLGVTCDENQRRIDAISLRCQVQLATTRRSYDADEQARLEDLFGAPSRWDTTLKPLLWTICTTQVPAFTGRGQAEVALPCTMDLTVATAGYFRALAPDGVVPLELMYSGTIFYRGDDGALQVTQIPWSAETRHSIPVRLWLDAIEAVYRGAAGLMLPREVFDRLCAYKAREGLPTVQHAIESLLARVPQ